MVGKSINKTSCFPNHFFFERQNMEIYKTLLSGDSNHIKKTESRKIEYCDSGQSLFKIEVVL